MRNAVRLTRSYRATVARSGPLHSDLRQVIGVLAQLLVEIEPKTKECAVCGQPWNRKTVRKAWTSHAKMCQILGRAEARKMLRQRVKDGRRREKIEREVFDYVHPNCVRLNICGRHIVVAVCSDECRARVVNGNKEYDECLINLHDSWQQVRAIKDFLRTPSLDAFQLLRPGLGPVHSSRGSCPR